MKNHAIFWIVLFALILSACVPSIHPFYEDRDVFFDANLIGKWSDESRTESWIFEKAGKTEYRLEYTDEAGRTGVFEARIFKIRDHVFLDAAPVRSNYVQGFYAEHLLSVHTFFALELDGGSARLMFLDPVWLKLYLEKNPAAVGHTVIEGEVVFTDTTKKLKAFINTHLETPGAFEQTEKIFKTGAN